MSRRIIVTKSILQFFALVVAAGLASAFASTPSQSFSFVLTLLAASYRPIWKAGRLLDRVLLFVLAALVGLSVWGFVSWLADYLFHSGIFDAGGAANVAGYRAVLASLAAYLTTRIDVGGITEWLTAKWQEGGASKLALVLTVVLAPYVGLVAAVLVWEGMEELDIENEVFVSMIGLLATGVVFPLIHKAMSWFFDLPILGLEGERAEGPRRLGLLAGWVLGAPFATFLHYQWVGSSSMRSYSDDDLVAAPFFGVVGLLLTYILVHAIFWAIDGFRSRFG